MTALHFEDFEVGQVFVSPARTVTEADLTMFSMLSGDWNSIHTDAEYAKQTVHGERIAHGVLGIAMATGFVHRLAVFTTSTIAMLGIREWSFRAPVKIGDTIHLRLTIVETRRTSRGDRGVVDRRFELVNQEGAVVQEGHIALLVKARDVVEVSS